jgi:hypothetical protein
LGHETQHCRRGAHVPQTAKSASVKAKQVLKPAIHQGNREFQVDAGNLESGDCSTPFAQSRFYRIHGKPRLAPFRLPATHVKGTPKNSLSNPTANERQ